MRLADQRPSLGGAVENNLLTPRRGQRLIVAKHAFPGGARMRRLDQRIGKIAKPPLVVGELELRRTEANASGHLGAHPAMHVVVEKILPGAAEIAAAAAAESHAYKGDACERRSRRKRPQDRRCAPDLKTFPDRKTRLRHIRWSDVRCDDVRRVPEPSPVRLRRRLWSQRADVRSARREGSGWFPEGRRSCLSPAAAPPHPPEIQ